MNPDIKLYASGPLKESRTYKSESGRIIWADKFMAGSIKDLTVLDKEDIFSVLGITSKDLEDYIATRKPRLCDKALRYLKDMRWHWSETRDSVVIDNEFMVDVLGQDVTKRTVYRRLKERRMTIAEVKKIIDFFEGEHLTQSQNQLF